jgi:hypothetical protein
MLKNLRLRSKSMLAALVFSILMFASNGANAQYCDFPGGYWGPYSPLITGVSVYEVNTSNVRVSGGQVSQKTGTGWDQYKNWGENYVGGKEGVQLGRRYEIYVQGLTNVNGYSGYCRVFFDLNANGKWTETGDYLGAWFINVGYLDYSNFTYSQEPWALSAYVNIPCNAPLAKTRIRVITGYSYLGGTPLSEPCVISYYDSPSYTFGKYYYGEVEDHEITILPDSPKSIPSDALVLNGSNQVVEDFTILSANQLYSQIWTGNQTSVPYPKPSLQFNTQQIGAQVQMEIQGPLPSTASIWKATTAQNGGSSTITLNAGNFTTITDSDGKVRYNYAPQFSSGPAANTSGLGDFTGTSGGEYKLIITIAGSGCPGAANRLFTVAFANDIAVSSISSPLNNDFPRYAKYGVGQTFKIEGVFQNVGLSDVTEFTTWYTIKDQNGTVQSSGTFVYDPNQVQSEIFGFNSIGKSLVLGTALTGFGTCSYVIRRPAMVGSVWFCTGA